MRTLLIYNADGKVVRTYTDPKLPAQELTLPGESNLLVPFYANVDTHYVADGQAQELPAKPGPWHRFDCQAGVWVAMVDEARSQRLQDVDAARVELTNQPIEYQGASLDADAISQKNISDKLGEISDSEQLNDPLPVEMLFWRDHDNQMHTFADQGAYKAWLQGLRIAIARRGTALYAWAWGKKAELNAATDLAAVLAVSLLSG